MRHRPLYVVAGTLAGTLVAASALAVGGSTPVEVTPVTAPGDDDPSLDDLGVTGDDVADPSPSPSDRPSVDDSPSPSDRPSVDDSATADDSPSPSDGPSVDDSPSPADTPAAATGSETYAVADVGTVTVGATPDGLVVTAVTSADGWNGHVEWAQGREVEVTFRSGDARVDFKAQVEDGSVRVRVRDRRVEDLEDARRDDDEDAVDEDRSGTGDDELEDEQDDDSDDDTDDSSDDDDVDDGSDDD